MVRKISKTLAAALAMTCIFTSCVKPIETDKTVITDTVGAISSVKEPVEIQRVVSVEKNELATREEINLLALVTIAEAEGENEKGKRLVIDTVLNRVDSKHFPNNIYDVIYEPNQFSPMWDGRAERCIVTEEVCKLVIEELENRTNHEVIFFTAYDYSEYGIPMFYEGNHYFSSYDERGDVYE